MSGRTQSRSRRTTRVRAAVDHAVNPTDDSNRIGAGSAGEQGDGRLVARHRGRQPEVQHRGFEFEWLSRGAHACHRSTRSSIGATTHRGDRRWVRRVRPDSHQGVRAAELVAMRRAEPGQDLLTGAGQALLAPRPDPVRGPPVLRVPSSCIVPRYIVLRCEERNDMAARPGGAATHRRCIVLSDHERKTLREFERQFQVEDPEFTARSAPGRSACVAGTSTERGSRSWPRCSCGCCRPWSRWRGRRTSTLVLPFPVELLRSLEHASPAATPDTAIPATTATMPPSGPPAATSTGPEPAAAAGAWENDAVGTGRAHPAAPKAATVAQGAAQR